MTNIILSVIVAVIAVIVGGIWRYRSWLSYHTRRTSAESQIVETRLGPVEFDLRGSGPTVLHFHGGNVGHNGWFMLAHLVDAGYQVLTPDRPGYLGTPLADKGSSEAQADVMAALLDKLEIEKVAVLGISGGGPGALQFALRHPHRLYCLILISATTQRTQLTDDQLNSTLGKLVMTPRFQNPAYFLIHQTMKHLTRFGLQDFIRTETTYSSEEGQRYIDSIMEDPYQRQQVHTLADAMVPALPRFNGVMNDLKIQQNLDNLPLERIQVPALIIHSRHDGDIPYENATFAHDSIPNSELITVDQFGHFVWWGDKAVTANFQTRIEVFLRTHIPS